MVIYWRTHYRCTNKQCKHTGYSDVFDGDRPMPVMNCPRCHAGFNMETADMLKNHVGMFAVSAATRHDSKEE